MQQLHMMDFPAERIRLDLRMSNDEILQEMKSGAGETKVLPKIASVYHDMPFPEPPAKRPYLYSSVVLSADGKMAFEDCSEGPAISKENYLDPDGALADFWVLNAARACADGAVIGARTLQVETGVTAHVFDPELLRDRQEVLGKSGHPVNIVASFDGTDIPPDHVIFDIDPAEKLPVAIMTSPAGGEHLTASFPRPVNIYGPYEDRGAAEAAELPARLFDDLQPETEALPVIVTGRGNRPDTGAFLALARRLGLERMLVESPSFAAHLMGLGLLDEMFVSYSMIYAGGSHTPGGQSPFGHAEHPHAELVTIASHAANFLYTRQRLRYGVGADSTSGGNR